MSWKSVLLFLSGFCLASVVQAQPEVMWSRTYGGEARDECFSLIKTTDGGYALAGSTESFGATERDFWFVQTDSIGESIWAERFSRPAVDGCNSILQTADGGFSLAGYTTSNGANGQDAWLIYVVPGDQRFWARAYGGRSGEECHSHIQTDDGGFALAGYSESFANGGCDFWLLRTDSRGDSLWARNYGGVENERCWEIIQTEDGGFALAGYTVSNEENDFQMWLVKTNSNGDSLWSRAYGGTEDDCCFSVIETTDGGFAMAGSTRSPDSGKYDVLLVRTGSNGDSLWARTYGGEDSDKCSSIRQVAEGGFVLAGYTLSAGAGNTDYWLIRIAANGDSLWSCTFGGEGSEVCYSVISTDDGGFAMAGYTWSEGEGNSDFWLVKTTPDPAFVSSNGFVPYPSSLSLLSPYPNPFNSSVSVGFRTAKPGLYALEVVDPLGKSLGMISQGYQTAGEHRIVWGADDLPAGNYWLRLTDVRGGEDVKPIVLVK